PLQIVCGAANVRAGMKTPVAVAGARLPGEARIERTERRGMASDGMLCSARELGLAESSDGIMELPADAPAGVDLREYLSLDDRIIDVAVTPNRADCLSVAGVAREIGVLNRCPVHAPRNEPLAPAIPETLPIVVEAPSDCPRYVGRVIRGIDPEARTPIWLRERLRRCGLRSLGPVVDVTNYVMLELGQPMHAFDLDALAGGIRVRRAAQGETITLLDGREIRLSDDVLVIADQRRAVAVAGIMGGRDTAVGATSTHLFLESAFFTPRSVMGRARRYGLQSESAQRFERGVDPELPRRAMERATELLVEIAGGRAGPVSEVASPEYLPARAPIRLRRERVRRLLGIAVPDPELHDILGRLGMRIAANGEDWQVTAPSFRFDVVIEVDLIEELGRVIGYDRIPCTQPVSHLSPQPQPEDQADLDRLRRLMVDRGYQEAITYSFVDPALQQALDPQCTPLALANPISSEMSVMRTTLWPGLLKALRYNLNRQQTRVRLFECGLRYIFQYNELEQENIIAAVATGGAYPEQWGEVNSPSDFYDAKADVEALLALTGREREFNFLAARHPALHPGQTAKIEHQGELAGWVGVLHPALEQTLGLTQTVLLFELRLDYVLKCRVPVFQELSKFPSVRRDIAIVIDERVSAQQVTDCITAAAQDMLQEIRVFDVYRGKGVDTGRKSIALGLILQDSSSTLTDQDVDTVIKHVVARLNRELGATLRE
ncbi:MAG: phenylalanine--tRNA ligase subunit beta, partial [Gammaproteobacteria bacterium]|nr:phenylalanine--tRNA ligase subunit beta [Gammaproteobacteria bacterium]